MDVIYETEALQRFFEGKNVYWSPVDVNVNISNNIRKNNSSDQKQMLYKAKHISS